LKPHHKSSKPTLKLEQSGGTLACPLVISVEAG
jgi:hypothetical protein